jgi:hypothetical protein
MQALLILPDGKTQILHGMANLSLKSEKLFTVLTSGSDLFVLLFANFLRFILMTYIMTNTKFFACLFILAVLGAELKASYLLGK